MICSSESCALLVDFYWKFCSGAELKCFEWEDLLAHLVDLGFSDCDKHIDKLLSLTVDHPTVRRYPLKQTYQKGFLKHFLNSVEERGLTHDAAYDRLVSILAEPEAESELHYRHFPFKNRFITIQESRNFLTHGTTGLHTWQAGIALANWGLRNKEHFHFKRVFELGCGLGLTGLALIFSDSPPLSYTFSDCHPEVLQLLKNNIILNSATEGEEVPKRINKTNVQVLDFNWSEEGGPRLSKLFQPDVIIAAALIPARLHAMGEEFFYDIGQRHFRRPGKSYRASDSATRSKYFPSQRTPKQAWVPPRSPYALIQEDLYSDPWQLLIATIFLTKTPAKKAIPEILKFLNKWPTPELLMQAPRPEILSYLKPLGLGEKRTDIIIRFTKEFLTHDWTYPIELYGIGKYGNDSYRIFCVNEWRDTIPDDIPLTMYRNWLMENSEKLGLN